MSRHANDTSNASHRQPVTKDSVPGLNARTTSCTTSRHSNDTSRASHRQPVIEDSVPRLNAQTTSRTTSHQAIALHRQPVDHTINQDNLGENEEIDDETNNLSNDADDEDEDEDTQVTGPKTRRSRTTNNDIRPSQLRFYSGTWIDTLIAAKNNYRLFIHTEDPFPERTSESLEDARNCLLEAIAKFKEESQLPLDGGMLLV